MKRMRILLGTVLFVLLFSCVAGAFSFDADASFLVGSKSKKGILINGVAEVFPAVQVDGSVCLVWASDNERLLTIGGLYQVMEEPDLVVSVGGGFLDFQVSGNDPNLPGGRGIFGKISLDAEVEPGIVLRADLGYAPRIKINDKAGNLVDARLSVSYQIKPNIGVQGTIKRYKVVADGATVTNSTLFGGGVVISF